MASRQQKRMFFSCWGLIFVLLLSGMARGDEAAADAGTKADGAEGGGDQQDNSILSKLTITLGSEVLDERSFIIRNTEAEGGSKKQVIRLGNVAKLDPSAADYEEKKEKATKALKQFAEKQMVFWKAAPDSSQTKEEQDGMPVVIADVWTIDGRHVPQALIKAGHLGSSSDYESEIAKDILMADADEKKRQSYKDLEEALKENNEAQAKKAAEDAAEAEESEPAEPLGFAGWMGLLVLGILVVGAFFNFGRGDTSKKSSRGGAKKKGFFATILSKLKLA